MSDYAIFFDYDNTTYRLPVNPEQIEKESVQAVSKYEILKLGQIAIPTHMELMEFSFEAEFPHEVQHYVETTGDFKDADFYLNLFTEWRNKLVSPRFIASNGIGDDINSLVLIESLTITEKAGEEGDKYVNFKLLEYREFGKKSMVVEEITSFSTGTTKAKKKKAAKEVTNPKSNGYHVVVSGDTLWSIAKKYYGDGGKSNIIFNANKDKIKKPALIIIGWKLRIPTKDEFTKYSAPLPKTIKVEPAIKKFTLPGEEIVAGFGAGW
jgi:LysM repeat protein